MNPRVKGVLLFSVWMLGCRGAQRDEVYREGDVLSVRLREADGEPGYAALQIISVDGDGCVLAYECGRTRRPREITYRKSFYTLSWRHVRENWSRLDPQRIGRLAPTEQDRRICELTYPSKPAATGPRGPMDPITRCQVELLRDRNGAGDDCVVRCIVEGLDGRFGDYLVAGGCAHVCGLQDWSLPAGWSACGKPATPESGPSPG